MLLHRALGRHNLLTFPHSAPTMVQGMHKMSCTQARGPSFVLAQTLAEAFLPETFVAQILAESECGRSAGGCEHAGAVPVGQVVAHVLAAGAVVVVVALSMCRVLCLQITHPLTSVQRRATPHKLSLCCAPCQQSTTSVRLSANGRYALSTVTVTH